MDTIVEKIDFELNSESSEKAIQKAAELLKQGELVAFPTETVYGLGGDGLLSSASEKIYAAKGRPSDNPLIIHIADMDAVEQLAKNVSDEARLLMKTYWPGPMTLIFEKKDIVPKETTGGLDTVAIRFPSHPVARRLIEASGVYIAAPSANLSGRPSPTKADHVVEDLTGRIAMILDGGAVDIGLESTIIDVSGEVPTILRPGYITEEMLAKLLGEIQVDPAIRVEEIREDIVAKAPGMKYKHYAPKGQLTIVEGDDSKQVISKINEMAKEAMKENKKVAIIATEESKMEYQASLVVTVGSRQQEETVAKHLFDCLRQMDQEQVDIIYCESFSRKDIGQAIMNRLLKAAGYQVLKLNS